MHNLAIIDGINLYNLQLKITSTSIEYFEGYQMKALLAVSDGKIKICHGLILKAAPAALQIRLRQSAIIAESLRQTPIRHNQGGVFTEIKMQFVPPTMCRLTFHLRLYISNIIRV